VSLVPRNTEWSVYQDLSGNSVLVAIIDYPDLVICGNHRYLDAQYVPANKFWEWLYHEVWLMSNQIAIHLKQNRLANLIFTLEGAHKLAEILGIDAQQIIGWQYASDEDKIMVTLRDYSTRVVTGVQIHNNQGKGN